MLWAGKEGDPQNGWERPQELCLLPLQCLWCGRASVRRTWSPLMSRRAAEVGRGSGRGRNSRARVGRVCSRLPRHIGLCEGWGCGRDREDGRTKRMGGGGGGQDREEGKVGRMERMGGRRGWEDEEDGEDEEDRRMWRRGRMRRMGGWRGQADGQDGQMGRMGGREDG